MSNNNDNKSEIEVYAEAATLLAGTACLIGSGLLLIESAPVLSLAVIGYSCFKIIGK